VAILSLIPVSAGGAGVLLGPAMIPALEAGPVDLDSHYRYLSGLLLGLGLVFWSCVPGIAGKTVRFQAAGAVVVCGGFARLLSLVVAGAPSLPHLLGLGVELAVVPALMLWQWRCYRRI